MKNEGKARGRMSGPRARAGGGINQAAGTPGQATAAAAARLVGARGEAAIIDVTMLGSVGTGKTTLLASMYERFDRVIGATDLAVSPLDHATSVKLQEYLIKLRSLAHELKVRTGIAGTSEIREYQFGVGRKGRKPLFTLRFTDYSGDYLKDTGRFNEEEIEKIQRALVSADVVLVAIDAPALVEQDGRYHDLTNRPQIVTDEIKRILQHNAQRLIILAALKCERYVETEAEARELADRITRAYDPLLTYIQTGDVRSRVACVLTPVQTIGSVVFSHIEEPKPDEPEFHFFTRNVRAAYAPVDTDQPLRYALRFIIGKYRSSQQRGMFQALWQQIIGTDAALVDAMEEFGAGCNADRGFKVLQDHPFLHPWR